MSKFKAGDRVCCYGQNAAGSFDVLNEDGDYGEVISILDGSNALVKMENDYGAGRNCVFHFKQLRKLKPKRKAREFVVCISAVDREVCGAGPNNMLATAGAFYKTGEMITVREVLPKKQPVSKPYMFDHERNA